MKKYLLLTLTLLCAATSFALTLEDGKTYTICNRNDNSLFVQDNGDDILAMGALNDNSYWVFEATGNADCYYLKNKATGRYAQACDASAEVNVTMGTEPVEYKILAEDVEGTDCFGITSTNLSNTEFTDGCIGWNWKKDNTVQTFAAKAGTNHRSFWKIALYEEPDAENKWPLDGKQFTIKNFSQNAPAYMTDTQAADNILVCTGEVSDYSYWTFEKTEKEYCYNVKNVLSGRYIQAYENAEEVAVTMGTEPAEYYVMNFQTESNNYGFSCTANSPYDFTAGTIGLNLRLESNQEGCCVQTYKAVAGTNHRSFWTLADTTGYVPTGITSVDTEEAPCIFDLQGRRLNSITRHGLYIINGKKVIK